jgi:pimeloyl-ACP methyl ester carboxylesterase
MAKDPALIFLHGLESSGRGFKGTFFRRLLPDMAAPDFTGPLEARMARLEPLLAARRHWVIVGSSFGGLMGALYTRARPDKVRKLILLAPALTYPEFAAEPQPEISVPTVIYHGTGDTVVPLGPVRALAECVFSSLTFHAVDDDHMLHQTMDTVDWEKILKNP